MKLHWETCAVPHVADSPFGVAFKSYRKKGDELLNALSIEMLRRGISPGSTGHAVSRSPWHESSPDILKRRQIVLRNPNLPAKSFCKLFDERRIPLPSGWEDKFNVTKWVDAYEDKTCRRLIAKIISTDKRKSE